MEVITCGFQREEAKPNYFRAGLTFGPGWLVEAIRAFPFSEYDNSLAGLAAYARLRVRSAVHDEAFYWRRRGQAGGAGRVARASSSRRNCGSNEIGSVRVEALLHHEIDLLYCAP
jgi:hypothetical protein